jgi:acyl dehydratase
MRPVKTIEPPDLRFEDFEEGQEFPILKKGPMMVGHQVRWAGATDNYDSEFHHDEYVAKAQGLPGIILSGPFIAAYLLSAIHGWAGRNARALRFADRNTGSTMPRDRLSLQGRITRKYREGGLSLIDLDCRVENQRGENTTPASATVAVPPRGEKVLARGEAPVVSGAARSEREASAEAAAVEGELKKMLGPLGEPEAVPVERLAVRRMALAVEDFDPIHFEESAARSRGYRGVVAPWPILWLLYFNTAQDRPQFSFGRATVHGEDAYAFFEPILAGDTITVSAAVTDARVKQGRSGLLGFLTTERRFTNGSGQLCATLRTLVIRR